MNATRKTRSAKELFTGFDTTIRHYVIDRPRAYYRVIEHRFKNLPKTNFDLGCTFADQGKWQDATFRFKLALYLQPTFTQAHYNLGCCYMQTGKRALAKTEFRKTLALKPDHRDAIFMLSALDEKALSAAQMPTRMPKEMVVGFFQNLAANFDNIERANNYNGPRIMYDALRPYVTSEEKLYVMDLGCGTGLCARAWRAGASQITGLDFTPGMASMAMAARVNDLPLFEHVLNEDLSAMPSNVLPANVADVILICNVAQFVGELSNMLKACTAALKPGGVLGVTVEPITSARGYGVNPDTGRFGHTPEYVKQVAATLGLIAKRDGKVNLYPQLQAHLLIFAKAA